VELAAVVSGVDVVGLFAIDTYSRCRGTLYHGYSSLWSWWGLVVGLAGSAVGLVAVGSAAGLAMWLAVLLARKH